MNDIYLDKYIKYKIKYLNLIKQCGGNYKPIIIFLCTHGKIIRFLLNNLGIKSANIYKLKNCAILRFEISKNNITIELVYEGEVKNVTKLKNNYYVLDTGIKLNNKKIFNKKILYDDISYNSLHIKRNDLGDDIYIFYLMRHGDKIHSKIKSLSNEKKDVSITKKGILQAQKAGVFLKTLLKSSNEKINFYFTSKLYRTQQTLFHAVGKHKIIIIPCLYQLDLIENKSDEQENIINNKKKQKVYCMIIFINFFLVGKIVNLLQLYPYLYL